MPRPETQAGDRYGPVHVKGTLMKNQYLWFALALIVVFVAAGLAQRDTAPRSGNLPKWEYAILRTDTLSWQERSRIVQQKDGPDFAAALGVPYSPVSDVFEINLINSVGEQGWALVAVPRPGYYVFQRPW
jgi:hypothetical protein